jgi:lipopolysaccharide transport system ATP-binding protein
MRTRQALGIMSRPIIEVENLSKRYRLGQFSAKTMREEVDHLFARFRKNGAGKDGVLAGERSEFWALKDVSFSVQPGEVVGVIGRNGAGKSTLLKILSRVTEPTAGEARIRGRVASLLEVGTGFHPELTGRENIYLNGAILGMTRAEIRNKFDEIVAFAEIDRFLDTPVKRYSSGMYVRLAFAVAAHLEPEILIVDEVLAVGDAAFQKKCFNKMSEVSTHQARTVLLVSHNMPSVLSLCARTLFLQAGEIVGHGDTANVIRQYMDAVVEVSNMDLATREDREGNGAIRFTRVSFVSDNGSELASVKSGDKTVIVIEYENNTSRDLRHFHVSIGIRDLSDNMACYFSSALKCNDFDRVRYSKLNQLAIRIPRLQLVPGKYTMTLFSKVGGDLADWIKGAITFEIQPGDYYGTGQLPAVNQGQFLPDYTFDDAFAASSYK